MRAPVVHTQTLSEGGVHEVVVGNEEDLCSLGMEKGSEKGTRAIGCDGPPDESPPTLRALTFASSLERK